MPEISSAFHDLDITVRSACCLEEEEDQCAQLAFGKRRYFPSVFESALEIEYIS